MSQKLLISLNQPHFRLGLKARSSLFSLSCSPMVSFLPRHPYSTLHKCMHLLPSLPVSWPLWIGRHQLSWSQVVHLFLFSVPFLWAEVRVSLRLSGLPFLCVLVVVLLWLALLGCFPSLSQISLSGLPLTLASIVNCLAFPSCPTIPSSLLASQSGELPSQ